VRGGRPGDADGGWQNREVASVAVVGPGAIGVAVAAGLMAHRPLLCGRRPAGVQRVARLDDGVVEVGPVLADPDQADLHSADPQLTPGPVDWVLLATKAHQSGGAAPWLRRLCGPGTVVAVLQNGIDHVERIQPLVPSATVLPVVVLLAADRTSPDLVRQRAPGRLTVPAGPEGDRFAQLFPAGDPISVRVSDDFVTQAWWKLMTNAAVGAVAALTLRDNGVLTDPGVDELLAQLMAEVVAVSGACGAKLPAGAPRRAVAQAQAAAHHWSSIAADRRDGNALEWEVRNAVVGRLGRRHGVPTPLNDAMTTLLRAADPGRDRRPPAG
jgi:2-dehydropantoate 2-reductase